MKSSLENLIKNALVVSFDIYDTLIKRSVFDPKDVFEIVEKQYEEYTGDKIDFKKERIDIEEMLRKSKGRHEVKIDEIYSLISRKHSAWNCSILEEYEKEVEKAICYRNEKYAETFDYCIKRGKTVILTSDMYLDSNTMLSILNICGINGYYKMYLSSEVGKRKKWGDLYRFIIADLRLAPHQILHIGDNIISDYKVPLKYGMHVFLARNTDRINKSYHKYSIQNRVLIGFLHRYQSNKLTYKIGTDTLGPLLFGFVNWLHINMTQSKIDKVMFLSRDGCIIKNAYESVFKENEVTSKYVYASRRALIVPSLHLDCSLETIQKSIHFHDRIMIKDILERLGLDYKNYYNQLLEVRLSPETRINGLKLIEDKKFVLLFNKIRDDIIDVSKKEYEAANKYWSMLIGSSKNIAIVDIGWNGNMQNALTKLLFEHDDINIRGYYLGVNPSTKHNIKMSGYLFDKEKNVTLYREFEPFMCITELLFMAEHGSTLRYTNDSNGVELYPYEYSNQYKRIVDENEIIHQIQKGALQFVHEWPTYKLSKCFQFSAMDSCRNLFLLGQQPSYEAAKALGDCRFFNSGIGYLARRDMKKLCHQGLINSPWKVGYLKRYLRVPFPYNKVLLYGKKVLHK